MNWPNKLKLGGRWIKLIVGERRIIGPNTSDYFLGEFREKLGELEISEGEDEIDIFLHEMVHAICYLMGRYDEPDADTDEGWEDTAAQAIRAFLLDNADFVRDLLDEIESPGG